MNEAAPAAAPQIATGLVRYTHWIYGLHALALLLGIGSLRGLPVRFVFSLPSIIAVIMNYSRQQEARGTWLESHFHWQIRTFWFALLWIVVTVLVSLPLMIILIGLYVAYLGWSIIGLWVIYRIVRGWVTLSKGRPMPASIHW